MAGPPPHGNSLGLWKVTHKVGAHVVFEREGYKMPIIVPMNKEEAEYFVVGQSYSFSATQP